MKQHTLNICASCITNGPIKCFFLANIKYLSDAYYLHEFLHAAEKINRDTLSTKCF